MNLVQFSFGLFVSVVLFMVVMETQSAAVSVSNSENPEHPGFCYYDDHLEGGKVKFYLKPGQRRRHPKLCYEVVCHDDLGLSTVGCGAALKQIDNCYFARDLSQPYPRCCGQYVCK